MLAQPSTIKAALDLILSSPWKYNLSTGSMVSRRGKIDTFILLIWQDRKEHKNLMEIA